MKRCYFSIFVVTFLFILFVPITALANSPAPSPYHITIAIKESTNVIKVSAYGSNNNRDFYCIESDLKMEETRSYKEKIVDFYNDEAAYKYFRLQLVIKGTGTIDSNSVEFKEWGGYVYNAKDNILKEGKITSSRIDSLSLIFIGIFLLVPLIVTLIVEWWISIPFKFDTGKYVIIANLITNPIMNILILFVFNHVYLNYLLIVLILEIIVAAAEYGFYRLTYKEEPKGKLLKYAILANLGSWTVYSLISGWIFGVFR